MTKHFMIDIDALMKLVRISGSEAAFGQAINIADKTAGVCNSEEQLAKAGYGITGANALMGEWASISETNSLDYLTLDKALKLAKQNSKEGQIEKARNIYQEIVKKFPKNKRAINALRFLTRGVVINSQDPPSEQMQPILNFYLQGQLHRALTEASEMLKKFPNSFMMHNIVGSANHGLGQFEAAINSYEKAIKIQPDNAEAYNNKGNALHYKGDLDVAIESYKKAIKINPDYAEAHSNLGSTLQDDGKLEAAIESFRRALRIKPFYTECYYNMGVALNDIGDLDGAIQSYKKALKIAPDFAKAHYNMGTSLQAKGDLEIAINSYKRALMIKPDFLEAYNNMGISLNDKGDLKGAIESFKQALEIKPDHAEGHNNMGVALCNMGDLDAAIDSYKKAIKSKPEYTDSWNNIMIPLQVIKLQISSEEELLSCYPENTSSNGCQIAKSVLNYRLNRGSEKAEASLAEALSFLSRAENIIIKNPNVNEKYSGLKPHLPNKVVALVHFGRSGTGLLHSLIDGHPEVSTLPSIYFSQFFSHSNWKKITAGGWKEMAKRFIETYQVLFDASTRNPNETKSGKPIEYMGQKEGMANVGDQQNEVLNVNKIIFRKELNRMMNLHDDLDAFSFFKLAHSAYEKSLNDQNHKALIFYHIHNPDTYAQLNFLKSKPDTNWIMMVREPLQSCESWIRPQFDENNYSFISSRIISMLFEIDNIIYSQHGSVGVRLEDLKECPKQTIPALCNWMGIEENESLYEMTAQGKKWWGDPTSPDFEKDGMDPFGKTSINRKVGSIFSESDQFILRTLFYPFSVRFGYVEENVEQFRIDLQAIRPMLDQMFDFEKSIVKRTDADIAKFLKSGSYLYLRSGLVERWGVLNQHHTYPNMINPLKIDVQ